MKLCFDERLHLGFKSKQSCEIYWQTPHSEIWTVYLSCLSMQITCLNQLYRVTWQSQRRESARYRAPSQLLGEEQPWCGEGRIGWVFIVSSPNYLYKFYIIIQRLLDKIRGRIGPSSGLGTLYKCDGNTSNWTFIDTMRLWSNHIL